MDWNRLDKLSTSYQLFRRFYQSNLHRVSQTQTQPPSMRAEHFSCTVLCSCLITWVMYHFSISCSVGLENGDPKASAWISSFYSILSDFREDVLWLSREGLWALNSFTIELLSCRHSKSIIAWNFVCPQNTQTNRVLASKVIDRFSREICRLVLLHDDKRVFWWTWDSGGAVPM